VFITVGVVGIYFWRIRDTFRLGSGDKIRDTYIAFINLLAYKGYPKSAAQTPLEFASGLRITQAYLIDKYGKNQLDESEVENIKTIWKQLSDKWLHKTRD